MSNHDLRTHDQIMVLSCRLRDRILAIKHLSETDEYGRRPRLVFTGVTDQCPNRTVSDMLADALQIGADLMGADQ